MVDTVWFVIICTDTFYTEDSTDYMVERPVVMAHTDRVKSSQMTQTEYMID